MTSYEQSPDYVVGLRPTNKAGDLLVLNDDNVVDLLKAAVEREGSQTAFAKRYDVNRSELNSVLNGRRHINASLAKALGLRRVYVVGFKPGSSADVLSRYMTRYVRSLDYVGLKPTCKAGDLLVLNDDDVVDLLKAAVKREGGQIAFAKRYRVDRTNLSAFLNGRRRVRASLAKALGLRRVYVVEEECRQSDEQHEARTGA